MGKFRWSRIRQNLGREPPQTPLTIFDQPLYRTGIQEASQDKPQSYVPHDEFLNELPRLPFPLISLPEAAMLQYFRRERGEEDHTDPTNSFAGRKRPGTFSTLSSSNFPQTPVSSQFNYPLGSSQTDLPMPNALLHNDSGLFQLHRRRTSKPLTNFLVRQIHQLTF